MDAVKGAPKHRLQPPSPLPLRALTRYLAWTLPDHVLPAFMDTVVPALQTLTHTHQTISVLATLATVATPLISFDHFPRGAAFLPALLQHSVPGTPLI